VNSDYNERKVIVKEGIVAVYRFEDKRDKLILNKGEQVIFDNKQNQIRKIENTDENYLSWKTKVFNFNHMKLEDIFDDLETVYDIKFEFVNPELRNCRQTVSFKDQEIDEIINVLIATFDHLSFKKNNHIVLVDGESCNSP
jgi:ferric-dicitrate binding protein FerR (iron transport regulator)